MERKSYIRADVTNRNHTTHLRGIVRVENDYFYRNGNAVSNGSFVIHVHSHILATDYYSINVQHDKNGKLKLSMKGLAKSKKAFNEICYTLFYDHVEVEKTSDVYEQRAWDVICRCVASHVSVGEWQSVFDIIADDNAPTESVEISRAHADGEKKIQVQLNDDFVYEHDYVKFRVRCVIDDEARNVRFSGTFLVMAAPHCYIVPSFYDVESLFIYAALVTPGAVRKAILQAMENGTRNATICGKLGKYDSMKPSNSPSAQEEYKQIMEYFHSIMRAAC